MKEDKRPEEEKEEEEEGGAEVADTSRLPLQGEQRRGRRVMVGEDR